MFKVIRRSLRWKLLFSIALLIVFIVALVGTISYREGSQSIRNEIELFSNQIIGQANLNLNRYFWEYEYGFVLAGTSSEFQKWLSVEEGNRFEINQKYKEIEQKYFLPFVNQHPEILSITLYNVNGNQIHYRGQSPFLNPNYSLRSDAWVDSIGYSNQVDLRVSMSSNYFDGAGKPVTLPVITMAKRFKYFNSEGFLKMDISMAPTLKILDEIQLGQQGRAIISDEQGQVIASPVESAMMKPLDKDIIARLWQTPSGSFLREKTNEMVVFQTIPYTGWKSLIIVPYRDIASGIYRMRNTTVVIALISIFVSVILILFLSNSFTKGIQRLQQTIKQTQLENLDVEVPISGDDEVADLGRAYNKMIYNLRLSLEQLEESKAQQKEAVQSALQSQINSHFLYNALESINSMANLIDHKQIEQTTISLSNMLRYTSNYQNTLVALREELDYLSDYIYIIGILHGEDISIDMKVSESCMDAPCLKAIIQPLVENCVKHGFEATGSPLHVRIVIDSDEDDHIRILIADNGAGFSEEKLHQWSEMLQSGDAEISYKSFSRVGLLNVHFRLRMFYHPVFAGIRLNNGSAEEGGGGRVEITYPRRTYFSGQN